MKNKKVLYIVSFCLFFGIISASFWILPKQKFSENEKRVLQSAPKFSISRLSDGRFFESADSYIADHFPGRDAWIGLHAYFQQLCGLNSAEDIYRGKDGWLIKKPIEKNDLYLENVDKMIALAGKTEIPVTLAVIPSKGRVMSDMLPGLHDKYPDEDMLREIKMRSADKIEFTDLTEAVSDPDGDTFYKTDHHWTSVGAFHAYRQLCRLWGIKPAEKSDFDITEIDDFYGTLYSKSGLWFTEPDHIQIWMNPSLQTKVTITDENLPFPKESDDMFFTENLDAADKYPVFLDGNHACVTIKTNTPGGRLLIVRDSFAHCLAPFLAQHFSEIDLIDLRYFKDKTISELLSEKEYDRVLFLYSLSSLAEERSLQLAE